LASKEEAYSRLMGYVTARIAGVLVLRLFSFEKPAAIFIISVPILLERKKQLSINNSFILFLHLN